MSDLEDHFRLRDQYICYSLIQLETFKPSEMPNRYIQSYDNKDLTDERKNCAFVN